MDGNSSDGTDELVKRIASSDSRVELLINKHKKTPYAFEPRYSESPWRIYLHLGSSYYLRTGLYRYLSRGTEASRSSRLQWPANHPTWREWTSGALGCLDASPPFWYFCSIDANTASRLRGYYSYPVFLKSAVLDAGAYNTQLHRNQDNDLNQRLRARGYKLYITDRTTCEYFVSPNLVSLATYAFNNGFWNIISFRMNPDSMSLRHFVPGAFVTALLLSFLMLLYSVAVHTQLWMLVPLLLLAAIYGLASIAVSCHIALRERSVEALLMPITFFLLHVSYGVGTLSAVMSNARSPSS